VGGFEYPQTVLKFTAATDADLAYTEIKVVNSNDSTSTAYSWYPSEGGSTAKIPSTAAPAVAFFDGAGTGASSAFVFARSVNRSGIASSWALVLSGISNQTARVSGTMADQDSTDVSVTGFETTSIKTGNGSSVREVIARYVDSAVPTLTGGSASETFSVSLTNRGFGAKPDAGSAQCASDGDLVAAYDFDNGSNSSTNAVIRVDSLSGNITAGPARFSVELVEYN
jgi:hypothetical protein